jgi:hypothetical protein
LTWAIGALSPGKDQRSAEGVQSRCTVEEEGDGP